MLLYPGWANITEKKLSFLWKFFAPTLVFLPDNVVIHNGSNDITKFNYNNDNVEELAGTIINFGLECRSYGVSNIAVSSILKRNSLNINQ